MNGKKKIIVLGIGNDIMGDDAVGLVAARKLGALLTDAIHVEETNGLGLHLLDILEGYDHALLLDAAMTGRYEPGTVVEFGINDFSPEIQSSPHYAGLPEMSQIASKLGIAFPKDIRILAVEIEDPYQIHEGLTPAVEKAIPELVIKAEKMLNEF